MKSGVPWSVKGVEPEAREAAKAKARRAGLTLGAWLNQIIQDSGGTALADAEMERWADDDESPRGPDLSQINDRIAQLERLQTEANREIEQALETLAVRIARTPNRPAAPDPGIADRLARIETESQKRIERLSREIGMLANRYSDIESQFEANRQEITDTLERMSQRTGPAAGAPDIAKIQATLAGMEGRLEAVAKDARSAATTFEHALRAVMERVVSGEKRQQAQAQAFERSLDGLGGRIQEIVERGDSSEAEAVRALEHAVGEITEHFETIEKRRERASRAVEDAIKTLTERLTESDRRQGEQVLAPIAKLDEAVQRMTAQIEETDGRTEAAVEALGSRMKESDQRTQAALATIGKRLQESEERVKGTFATIHKRFQDSEERAQSAFAALEAKVQAQSRGEQGTLAAIDGRLAEMAERIDQNDTETKASRLALMRALDETRRRVGKLEDRPYYVAEPPPVEPEPVPEPEEPASAFASFVEAEEHAQDEDRHGTGLEREEPEHSDHELTPAPEDGPERSYSYDRPASDVHEADALAQDHVEEPPPFKTSETVWSLLAAARAAARAEGARPSGAEDGEETSRLDFNPSLYEEESKSRAPKRKARARSGWARPVLISVFVLAAVGFSAWQLSQRPAQDEDGRPSFFRSLVDSFNDMMKSKPAGEAPGQKAVHVTQGAPAPALPEAESVPSRQVVSVPESPAPKTTAPDNPLSTAKLDEAPKSSGGSPAAAAKAIEAVRAAHTAQERAEAVTLLTKAAEGGNPDAQFTLGRVYETGRGVKTNLSTARDWYLKAADQGHVAAAFNLGMIEAQSGTREGYGHAARWFDQAARRGLADAQFNLGMLYAQGLGIGRDPVEAYAWFSAAAAQGDAGAAAERDRIGQALDESARARGEALARERNMTADTSRG